MKKKYKDAAKRNDYKWVTDGNNDIRIKGIELDYYLSIGYRRGRKSFSQTHIQKLSDSHKKATIK